MNKVNLILGSQSPRRKQLLGWLGVAFEIITADLEEISAQKDPVLFAKDIASQKALAVREKLGNQKNSLILTSDTIVVYKNSIIGKPKNREDAKSILLNMRDDTHEVITAVHFNYFDGKIRERCFHGKSCVTFDNFSLSSLDIYLNSKDYMDKAGAYGLQGPAMALVKKVEGSYSNIIGLPLNQLEAELISFLELSKENWRDSF